MAAKAKTRKVYVKAKQRRRKPGFTLPIAVLAGFAPLVIGAWNERANGGPDGAAHFAVSRLMGYDYRDHSWNLGRMKMGLLPIMGGLLIHKFVGGKLGVNRMLARAGFPIIRL